MIAFDNIYQNIHKRAIVVSFVICLLLDFMPLPLPLAYWLPEFTALMLMFWLLHRPQNIGISIAFLLGLLLDIGNSSPLGMHALAFVLAAFLVQQQQRQILLYSFGFQALMIFGALMLIQLNTVVVYFFHEHRFSGWGLLISPFIGALLWPLLNNIMLALANSRRRR